MGLTESPFTVHNTYVVVVLIWIYYVVGIQTDNYFTSNSENFESVPTTVKTFENDTVLLPCSPVGELMKTIGLENNLKRHKYSALLQNTNNTHLPVDEACMNSGDKKHACDI